MNCWVVPSAIEGAAGIIVIDCRVGAAVTVSKVEPTILPEEHLMVAVPAINAVARPCVPAALLTVATVVLVEPQVTDCVRSKVLPPLKVPVARNCSVVPASTEGLAGVTAIETRPAVEPVPDRLTVCGLFVALSVMVRVPVRVPTTVGVNVVFIVHLLPAATELPQVLVWAKSPVTVTLVIESAVV